MSESNIVPIDFHTETLHKVIGWADQLRAMLADNKVAALIIRGVDTEGDPIEWSIIPDKAPSMRYMLIGQLQEAVSDLIAERPELEA